MKCGLTPQDEALWKKISPLISGAERFRPPRVRDIANLLQAVKEPEIRRFFKVLSRMGRVDEVAHDHFFLRGTVAEMVEICAEMSQSTADGQFHRRAIARSAGQRPQSLDPDSRVLRSPRCHISPRRSCGVSTSTASICFARRRG
jgi:hypothetical protein